MTPRAIWLALAVSACSKGSPAPAPVAHLRLDEDACATCHADEYREWRGSMHHAAFTSRDFQHSYQAEPQAFCADCHAPRRARGGAGEASGIGCAECHGELDAHVKRTAHATTRSCVPCHDFPVPNERAFLQSTAREHAESAFADTPCEGCHLPRVERHRSHAFAASRDPRTLREALQIATAHAFDGHAVGVRVTTRGVGHRFPTGDIFRRVTLTVSGTDAAGRIVCDRIVHLQRDWDEHRRALHEHDEESLAHDTRLGNAPLLIETPCSEAPTKLRVDVDYARGADASARVFTAFEEVPILGVELPALPE